MKLQHLAPKRSSQTIVEAIESYFESVPKVSSLSETDTSTMLMKVQSLIKEFRTTPQFHLSEKNPKYLKLVMLEQALATQLDEYAGASTLPSAPSIVPQGPKASVQAQKVKPTDIEAAAKDPKIAQDPGLKDMLQKAASGVNMDQDEITALAALVADKKLGEEQIAEGGKVVARVGGKLKKAVVYKDSEWDEYVVRFFRNGKYESGADYHTDDKEDAVGTANNWVGERSPVIEDREYSIRYFDEDDVWAVVDSVGNRVENFIEKHEAAKEARKLNAGSKAPSRHRHVNYRGDMHESTRKKQDKYSKGQLMNESKKLQQAPTKQLVEFYRKHRGTNHKSVKLVEAELKRRQRVVEARKSGKKMISESEIQLAQVVLAAQEMVDQVQKMVEQASATQYKDLPALVSQVRIDLGSDQSAQFNQAATEAFQGLLQSLQDTKNKLEAAVGIVTGQGGDVVPPVAPEAPVDPVAAPDAAAADLDLDLDAETDDITGLGRERR